MLQKKKKKMSSHGKLLHKQLHKAIGCSVMCIMCLSHTLQNMIRYIVIHMSQAETSGGVGFGVG